MQWSTGSEVEGQKNAVRVEACEIAAGETGIVKIDLSEAYDIEQLKGRLADEGYFDGRITKELLISHLQNRVDLYLADMMINEPKRKNISHPVGCDQGIFK